MGKVLAFPVKDATEPRAGEIADKLHDIAKRVGSAFDSLRDSLSLISQFKKNKMLLWHI